MKKKLKPKFSWADVDLYGCTDNMWIGSRKRFAGDVKIAVIPLDDVDKIVDAATAAYSNRQSFLHDECIRAALTAIGVLPKQRKGRK
jgi:hypothetical protein